MQLIDNWKLIWKSYSFYGIIILGALPDLFNAAIASGVFESTQEMPFWFNRIMNLVAFATLAGRIIKQKALEAQAQQPQGS